MTCDEAAPLLGPFLDGEELSPELRERVAQHLAGCPRCATRASEHRRYLDAVARGYRPEPAPTGLRRAVARSRRPRWAVALAASFGAACLVAVGWATLSSRLGRRAVGPSLAEAAVADHLGLARGQLPLDIETADPTALTRWFERRLPFALGLPAFTNPALRLLGARIVDAAGQMAALVEYRLGDRPVSLLVAADQGEGPGEPVGRAEVFKNLQFQLADLEGFHVILWHDRGLRYALVSDLPSEGRASCVVCHAPGSGMPDIHEFVR
ncbi:MAG: anti-sigma factor family protein [Deltaproteobacteria bacterium]